MEESKLYYLALKQVQDSNPEQIPVLKNLVQIYDQNTDPISSVRITSQQLCYFNLFTLFSDLDFVLSVYAFQF